MIASRLELQKPLEDYIELFEKVTARSLSLFDGLLDDGFIFEDPYLKAIGHGGFKSLMLGRFSLYAGKDVRDKSSLGYRVHDFAWGQREDVAYMYWSMIFSKGSFEGMSEICMSGNGVILSQRDFWGAHDEFNIKAYKAFKL